MFIVFTAPNQFTKTIDEAEEIRTAHYEQTGEIVAVELSQHHPNPWRTLNNY